MTNHTVTVPAPAGAVWLIESVSKEPTPGVKITLGHCPILHVEDLGLFMDTVGMSAVAAIVNGTSIRVKCQDLGRSGIARKLSLDDMARRILNWLSGVRNSAVRTRVETRTIEKIVTRKVHALPNGEIYDGDDVDEYRSLVAAALVDAGLPADVALAAALNFNL